MGLRGVGNTPLATAHQRVCGDKPAQSARALLVHDERGASILIALFYFLVCAVVGAVVLTAATVTSGQLANLEKSQQTYYATSSAATVFRDAIENGTCTSSFAADDATWTCELPALGAQQEPMRTWLQTMVSNIAEGQQTASATFDITLDGSSIPEDSIVPVSATMTMRSDYSLYVSIRPQDYRDATVSYHVTVEIPAALLYREDESSVERITWGHAVIAKPEEGDVA